MRIVKIDLSSDQNYPQCVFGGYTGENNETKLVVKLPLRMIREDVSYYYFDFHTIYNEQITSPNIYKINENSVDTLIWQQLIPSVGDLKFNVVAVNKDSNGKVTTIGKTAQVTLQIKGVIPSEEKLLDVEQNENLLQKSFNELEEKIQEKIDKKPGQIADNNAIVLGDTPTEDALAPSSIIGGKNNKNGCKGWKVTSIEKVITGADNASEWINQPPEMNEEWKQTNYPMFQWGNAVFYAKTSSTNKFKLYALPQRFGKDLLAFDTEFTKQDLSAQTDVDIFANEYTEVLLRYSTNSETKQSYIHFCFTPLFKIVCEGINGCPDIAVGDYLNVDCVFHSYQLRANKVVKDETNKTTTLYIYTTMALQYGEDYSFVWLEKDPYAGDTVVLMDKDQLTDNYDTSVTLGSNTQNNGYMGTAIGSEVINRGKYGVALGGGAKSLGYTGIAMGRNSEADQSVTIGARSKTANGANSIGEYNYGNGSAALIGGSNVSGCSSRNTALIGNKNTNIGLLNALVGDGNSVHGVHDYAMGHFNRLKGTQIYAFGRENTTSKPINGDVFMFGGFNTANHNRVYMLGERLNSGRATQTILGEWNEGNPDTVFELGDGISSSNKLNALTVRMYKRQSGAKGYALRLGNKTLNCELTDDDFKKLHNIQTDLDKKLDKQTSDVFKVYGTRNNQQIMTEVSDATEAKINTIAMRDNQGHLSTKTPTLDTHATNKKYVDDTVASQVSSVYKAKGSVADLSSLPTPDKAHEGFVYNIENGFTTTDLFVEGAGKTYPAGTNVVIVNTTGAEYKYDVLAGMVDLSSYATKTELSGKVDKVSKDHIVYANESTDVQKPISYTSSPTQYTIAYRSVNGVVSVGTPTADTHATTKSYVDNADALKMNKSAFDYNDTTKTLTIEMF